LFIQSLNPLQPTAIDDPQIIIDQFKQAAINAKEAGFDGVECAVFFLSIDVMSKKTP
jgi:2,4-dienoyl-CoA reductase-like NADH-dependent reductase (Old Yellow Enzyme family)